MPEKYSDIPPMVWLERADRWVLADSVKELPDGTLVEVIPTRDPREKPSDAVRVRPTRSARAQRSKRAKDGADTDADAMASHSRNVESMDENRRDLALARVEHGENLTSSDAQAYRKAMISEAFKAKVRALKAARRKGTSEILTEILTDAHAIDFRRVNLTEIN